MTLHDLAVVWHMSTQTPLGFVLLFVAGMVAIAMIFDEPMVGAQSDE